MKCFKQLIENLILLKSLCVLVSHSSTDSALYFTSSILFVKTWVVNDKYSTIWSARGSKNPESSAQRRNSGKVLICWDARWRLAVVIVTQYTICEGKKKCGDLFLRYKDLQTVTS